MMKAISLYLSRLAVLAVLFAAGTARAEAIRCPSHHDKHALTGATVFDGPVEELASLVPDDSKESRQEESASWAVGYIYDAGRKVFLQCRFSGTKETVTVAGEQRVTKCVYRAKAGGPVEVGCR